MVVIIKLSDAHYNSSEPHYFEARVHVVISLANVVTITILT